MYVDLAMKALLRFKPILDKPEHYSKRFVFLYSEPRGLVAMRCDAAHIWATTVPWYLSGPAKPVYYATTTKVWQAACKAGQGDDPYATHEHVLSVNGVELPRATSGKYLPAADMIYRLRCGQWCGLSPYVPAAGLLDELHNAHPNESGSVSLGFGKHQYLYDWQALMRWLTACISGTTFNVAFGKHGAIYLKTDTDSFELVLMCRNEAKGA